MSSENRTIQATSAEAAAVRKAFLNLQPGETIEDSQVNALVGGNWRSRPWAIDTARRQALSEEVVICRVRGYGWKRTASSETAQLAEDSIRRIRKTAKVSLKKQATVNPEELTQGERMTHYVRSAVLGVVAHTTSTRQQNLIASKITSGPISIANTLQAFRGE